METYQILIIATVVTGFLYLGYYLQNRRKQAAGHSGSSHQGSHPESPNKSNPGSSPSNPQGPPSGTASSSASTASAQASTGATASSNPPTPGKEAEAVGAFYDQYNDDFLKVYGEVIQAFRTTDVGKLLNYQIEAMDLKAGMKVLDAGCGVAGPATWFAQHAGVEVDAVTISRVQHDKAQHNIAEKGLTDKVRVHHGDYHQLPALLPTEQYDVVYFLESFGHSHDKKAALDSAWEMLKPGGTLYIKDLFKREAVLPGHREKMDYEINKINTAYHYHIADLYEVLTFMRQKGWILSVMKTIDLKLEEFENLTISNDFQELTGIARIENWGTYIFPVDFFELKCYKPWHSLDKGNSRYFLQNLYWMQVHNKPEAEL